jgi:hypothetical protein
MTPAIADGAPDPRCPGQTRAMFKFRQPDDLFHALKTVKGLLLLVPPPTPLLEYIIQSSKHLSVEYSFCFYSFFRKANK